MELSFLTESAGRLEVCPMLWASMCCLEKTSEVNAFIMRFDNILKMIDQEMSSYKPGIKIFLKFCEVFFRA